MYEVSWVLLNTCYGIPQPCPFRDFRPAVNFTIGPKDPREDLAGFKTYATKLGDLPPEKVEATIGGVIHGEAAHPQEEAIVS